MAKLPNGCTLEKVKVRGKILAYELRQGDRHWNAPTEAQALAAREADIQRACEECSFPIVLESPTDDPTELLCGFRVLGAWRYSVIRKQVARTDKELECHGGYGEYKTRAECERHMRIDAARLAVRIGPFAEGCKVIADGLDYLDRSASEVEDFRDQRCHVAFCQADAMARGKGLADDVPMSPASQYRDEAIGIERKRIHDVYMALRSVPTYRYNVAESFRQGRLVSR